MEAIIDWVIRYKEVLFSGVGTLVLGWIVTLIFKKNRSSSSQNIRSGDRSTNVQAGRDISIVTKAKGNDVEDE